MKGTEGERVGSQGREIRKGKEAKERKGRAAREKKVLNLTKLLFTLPLSLTAKERKGRNRKAEDKGKYGSKESKSGVGNEFDFALGSWYRRSSPECPLYKQSPEALCECLRQRWRRAK